MKINLKNKNKGFVLLFAITVASIVLAVTLGVANIILKEAKFATSARESNDAFFAADTGADCALLNDKSSSTAFLQGGATSITCMGNPNISLSGAFPSWDFVVTGLGSSGVSCAKVNVVKDNSLYPLVSTIVTSRGYNVGDNACNAPASSNRVERELKVTYKSGYPTNYALGQCGIGNCSGISDGTHPINNLTDGSYTTMAYPSDTSLSYEVDLGQVRFVSIINIVLCAPTMQAGDNGCFGYNYSDGTPYIDSWSVKIKLNQNDAYSTLSSEGIAVTPGRNIVLHPNMSLRYIRFDAASTQNWIGAYELEAFSSGSSSSSSQVSPSADCTQSTTIADSNSDIWTIGSASETLKNGTQVGGGYGSVYFFSGGIVYVKGTDNNWYKWTGSIWQGVGSTQPTCSTVNALPIVNAGPDKAITLPTSSSAPTSATASDPDGSISSKVWSYISGPVTPTITNGTTYTPTFSGMSSAGTYVFRLTATDNQGGSSTDDMQVVVSSGSNIPPTANAGPDKAITLPTSSSAPTGTSATDTDGTVSSTVWSFISGPVTPTITSGTTLSPSFTGMSSAGTYVFRLTVTDNNSATTTDDMQVVVSAAGPTEIVWFDDSSDSFYSSAVKGSDFGDSWTWVSSNPTPYSGSQAHQSANVSGWHQHYFYGSSNLKVVNFGDTLFVYAYLDPVNPPTEIMLQWPGGGTWDHRAYWGANILGLGTDGTASRRYMGALPPTGQWVRLEVPASLVGLEGLNVDGLAFTLNDGKVTWDRAGQY